MQTRIVFQQLFSDPDNTHCFDCNALSPQWASVNNSILLCLNCAGVHRGMGVQTSFVRSINLDSWTETQLSLMTLGGNRKFREFLNNYQLNEEYPAARYQTRAADFYRRQLGAKCNGNTFNDVPPTYDTGREKALVAQSRTYEEIMQGNPSFGSNGNNQQSGQS